MTAIAESPEIIPTRVDGSGADEPGDPGDVAAEAVANSTNPSPSVKIGLDNTPLFEIWNNCELALLTGEITQKRSFAES